MQIRQPKGKSESPIKKKDFASSSGSEDLDHDFDEQHDEPHDKQVETKGEGDGGSLTSQEDKALIVIDVQYDFLPGGSLAVKDGDKIIPTVKKLMFGFDTIATTQDWHPADHVSFISQHENDEEYKNTGKYTATRIFNGESKPQFAAPQLAWPDHCIAGRHGADIHADLPLSRVPAKARFKKGTDKNTEAYGPFVNVFGKEETSLADYLRAKNIKTVYVCGLALDYCVKNCCLQARAAGFNVVLILDATKAVNVKSGDDEAALAELGKAGVQIEHSQSVLKRMQVSHFMIQERKKLEKLENFLKDYMQHLGQADGTRSEEDEDQPAPVVATLRNRKIEVVQSMLRSVERSKELLVDRAQPQEAYLAPLSTIVTNLEKSAAFADLPAYRGSKCQYYLSVVVDALSCLLVVPAVVRASYSKYHYNNAKFWQTTGARVADRTKELAMEITGPTTPRFGSSSSA